MELNLTPQVYNQKIYDGEGGSYYSWSPSKSPILSEANVGGGRLALQPLGFAFPHYGDCNKIGYVLQGSCTVGMLYPNSQEEKVLVIKKGDAILVDMGVVSWWYNGGDVETVVLFLGETSKAYTPGEYAYFFLTGAYGMLGGFSTEFVSRLANTDEAGSTKLTKSQPGALIIKLKEAMAIPPPSGGYNNDGLVFELGKAKPDVEVKNGGMLTNLTVAKLAAIGMGGVSGQLLKLEANAMVAPSYIADSSFQMTYVVKGSGRLQIVGLNGMLVLDAQLKAGHMFVVPKFLMSSIIAGDEGLECFSIITSSQPVYGQLAGSTSLFKAIFPQVLQASLNIDQEFQKLFISEINETNLIIPPTTPHN